MIIIKFKPQFDPQYSWEFIRPTSLFFRSSSLVPFLLTLSLVLLMEGCVTIPPGTGLSRGNPVTDTIKKKAWLSKVIMHDPSINYPNTVEESFTLNLLEYLGERKYFQNVSLLPGKLEKEDFVLYLEFDHFQQRRAPHPAYFPAAILTLTLYIWFGGPIYVDSSDFSGRIKIEDFDGNQISEAEAKLKVENNVSIWSSNYILPSSGIELRTQIINDLMNKAVGKLKEKGEVKR